jgi:hypothetical protein
MNSKLRGCLEPSAPDQKATGFVVPILVHGLLHLLPSNNPLEKQIKSCGIKGEGGGEKSAPWVTEFPFRASVVLPGASKKTPIPSDRRRLLLRDGRDDWI